MSDQRCLIQDCSARVYAPAGTGSLCKNHFLDFVRWRRRRGTSMFRIYGGMNMEERNTIVAEWSKTVRVE